MQQQLAATTSDDLRTQQVNLPGVLLTKAAPKQNMICC
jgi:hypothetical protein